jgi:undecaprenyl-diphosphatase
MNIFEAIILGAVQGLTEFLPVSSSGHLVLMQHIFGIEEPTLFFDTVLHVGTLAAVLVVLWKDIWAILRRIIQPMTLYLIIGTLPAVVVALLFKDRIEAAFSGGGELGAAFLVTSGALVVSESLVGLRRRQLKTQMNWLDALVIGICQGLAILPGVSRSGLTLSGALSRGLDREMAAKFSFMLSIPAILGALVLQLKDIIDSRPGELVSGAETIGSVPLIAGTVTAALVGFFAVRWMLALVKKHRLWGFAIYTAILGLATLVDQYITHFFF